MILLTDDGTMDTVLECGDCGEEFRGNYFPDDWSGIPDDEPTEAEAECDYEYWVREFIDDTELEHDCTIEPIRVAYRVNLEDGDVLAVFPDHVADMAEKFITSYQHVGQHSGASPVYVRESTREATTEEREALHMELLGVYDDTELVVINFDNIDV